MGKLINRALRYLTVLYIVGVLAAVAAFALVALPGGTDLAAAGHGDSIDVSSTTTSASVQIRAVIARLPATLSEGSSIVLYLEDDYVVPETISDRYAWFTVSGVPASGNAGDRQADTGRHYPTNPIKVATGDYFGNFFDGDDDTAIRIYIPDLFLGDVPGISRGFQGPVAGETLTLTIHKPAGIKNPGEADSHSLGYSILGPGAAVPPSPQHILPDAQTFAKIYLSDADDSRGKVITVSGTGFNDFVSATLYVKHYPDDSAGNPTAGRWTAPAATGARGTLDDSGDPNAAIADADAVAANRSKAWLRWQLDDFTLAVGDVMTEAETCIDIIANGTELGRNVVAKNNQVEIEFTVSNPPFRPGSKNLLCMVDDKGLMSSADVENFNLDPSIRVAPNPANAGDTVTVTALDYPAGSAFRWLAVHGWTVATVSSANIGDNGQGSAAFIMPGSIAGTVWVTGCWGGANSEDCDQEYAQITVSPARLSLSKNEVRPNESIIVRGSGFGDTPGNIITSAQIDGVDLLLVSDGGSLPNVAVSDSGLFAATFAVWPANPADDNPTLNGATLELEITDAAGFSAATQVTILPPTLAVTPDVAGPLHNVHLTGSNWPVKNSDGGAVSPVKINISGGGIDAYTTQQSADANGKWYVRYQVPDDVSTPVTLNVTATYGSDISQNASFKVVAANLKVTPTSVGVGEELTVYAADFAQYASNVTVKIGPFSKLVPTAAVADGTGNMKDLAVTVTMPSLDAGAYTVHLQDGGDTGAVAIGAVTVTDEHYFIDSHLLDALVPLGNNLVRVFYFDRSDQIWSFYDPRPEFAELNTLSELTSGRYYWILVKDSVIWFRQNLQTHNLICRNGNCWNRIVW